MSIHDVKFDIKDDPILQKSSQEPSKSSKCDGVPDALLMMVKLAYNSRFIYIGDP